MTEREIYPAGIQERIEASNTFEEMVKVAFDIIEEMNEPVGIVCGPITSGGLGSMEANIKELEKQILKLQGEGKSIFNQMPFEPRMQEIKKTPYYDPTRDHLMEVFYGTLLTSGVIQKFYFVPGWEASYGARWEHSLVQRMGGEIIYLENT